MKVTLAALLLFLVPGYGQADIPLTTQTMQLEQLIRQSQEQLKEIQELVKNSKKDTASLDKAERALERMSAGIEQSIEKYQGTKAYEKALLQMQTEDLAKQTAERSSSESRSTKDRSDRFAKFQSESMKANLADLNNQQKLETALRTAEPGFVPKLQTQAQLGAWQANTRLSSQMSEILTNFQALRQELQAKDQTESGIAALIKGSEIQNQKQREVSTHAGR